MSNKRRYVVETESESISDFAFGIPPHKSYTYYRWRWCARLAVVAAQFPPRLSVLVRSRILGRATCLGGPALC